MEAVYNHEVLLRKTNKSVENILERLDSVTEVAGEDDDTFPSTPVTPRKRAVVGSTGADVGDIKQLLDEHDSQTAAKFSELSGHIDVNNSKIDEVVVSITEVEAALRPTKDSLKSLESTYEQTNTSISVMQAQLDQLKADIGSIIDAIGSDLGTNVKLINQQVAAQDTSLLSTYSTKLDAITADLGALREHSNTADILQNVSTNLEALKDNMQASIASSNENFAVITPQMSSVLVTLEAQSSKLGEMTTGEPGAEILAAVHKSNDSHAAHANALEELKKRLVPVFEAGPAVSSDSPETVAALQGLSEDLGSLKEIIDAGLASHHENFTGMGTKIDDVLTTLEAHRAADRSADILAAVQKSNDSHAAHATALEGIKPVDSAPASGVDNSNLEPQIANIISTLESHTTALGELKTSGTSGSEITTPGPSGNFENLEPQITTIINALESHTTLLNEIKDDVSAEILTVLHDINDAHNSQNTVLAEIREGDVSDEILTALHASNDSHTNHAAALADLRAAVATSNESHASHSGVLNEIKAARSVETSPAVSGEGVNLGGVETQIGAIATILEDQNSTLSSILDAAAASNDAHAAHTTTLSEIRDATTGSIELHGSNTNSLSEIKEAITASNDLHTTHTDTLAEIKDATIASNDFHNSHSTILAELKDAASASSKAHTSHAASLTELKDASNAANDLHASHIAALTDFKTIRPSAVSPESGSQDLGSLETHISSIISTLETQNTTLSDIKEITSNTEVLAAVKDSHELLTSHTSLLGSIKEGISDKDILANISELKAIIEESRAGADEHGAEVKDLHESMKVSHSELAAAIGTLALGGAAGAGAGVLASKDKNSSSEALEEFKAVRAIVEKSSTSIESIRETTTSMAAQIDINHTTVTTSITTLSDELKAEIDASGTEMTASISALSGNIKNLDLDPLNAAVEECGKEVKGMNATIKNLDGSVKGTGAHVATLIGGVRLNDKGVSQIKEHSMSVGILRANTCENTNDADSLVESQPVTEIEPVVDEEPVVAASESFKESTETNELVEESIAPAEIEPAVEKEPAESGVESALDHVSDPEDPKKFEPATESDPIADDEPTESTDMPNTETSPKPEIVVEAVSDPVAEPILEEELAAPAAEPLPEPETEPENVKGIEPQIVGEPVLETDSIKEGDSAEPVPSSGHLPIVEAESEELETVEDEDATSSKVQTTPEVKLGVEEEAEGTESASTSAIASPISPSFPQEGSSNGKKGKKGKKEKKEKKTKDKKTPFVFDPDEDGAPEGDGK